MTRRDWKTHCRTLYPNFLTFIVYPLLLTLVVAELSGCAIQHNLVSAWETKPRQTGPNEWVVVGYREAGDDTIRTMVERRAEDEGICLTGQVRIKKTRVLSTVDPLIVDGYEPRTRPLTVEALIECDGELSGLANAAQ